MLSVSNNWRSPLGKLARALGWGTAVNLGLIAIAAIGVVGLQRQVIERATDVPENADVLQERMQVTLNLLRNLPSLGFDNAIADWAFLSYLQYFGDVATREQTGYGLNDDFFDLITTRDPRFLEVYPFATAGISYYLGDPETTIAYMDRGTDALSPQVRSDAFWLWRHKAIDQLLLLGDTDGAEYSMTQAADWARQAGETQFADFFQSTADFLRKNPNSVPVRFYAWMTVYQEAVDAPIRQRAEDELLLLGAVKRQLPNGQITFELPAANP
jgi:hypothetical protein